MKLIDHRMSNIFVISVRKQTISMQREVSIFASWLSLHISDFWTRSWTIHRHMIEMTDHFALHREHVWAFCTTLSLHFGRKAHIIQYGFPQHSCFSVKKAENSANFAAVRVINQTTHHNYPVETRTNTRFTRLYEGFFFYSGLWSYWHCGHSWHIVPASGDNEDDCGEADGM
jgi:hypothetical protein